MKDLDMIKNIAEKAYWIVGFIYFTNLLYEDIKVKIFVKNCFFFQK